MAVRPVPEGYATVSVYLVVRDARRAIDFYCEAFGAEPASLMAGPDGESVIHAEVRIGDSTVMLTSENLEWDQKSPETVGAISASLHLAVEDVDAAFERAVTAGCEVVSPLVDMFWGDRYGKVKDPFGHVWGIATHIEDVPEEEMGERAAAFFAQMAQGG